jgi:hypothetical protein
MDLRSAAAVVLSFLLSTAVQAADLSTWCGTSAQTSESARELGKFGTLLRARSKADTPDLQLQGNVIVVEPDESMLPFANFPDIENKSVHLRRTSADSFAVRSGALEYVEETGNPAHTFNGSDRNEYHLYSLRQFEFPFGQNSRRDLYISERTGIFFAPPEPAGAHQLYWLDLATQREAVIAPYLEPDEPRSLRFSVLDLFIQETSERVVVTWRSRYASTKPFNPLTDGIVDLQAVLERDGSIRFSYRKLQNLDWGSPLITTGEENSRNNSLVLAAADDSSGDAVGSATYRNLLDIRRVEVRRIDHSELLKIHIRLGGRVFPNAATSRILVRADFSRGDSGTGLSLSFDGDDWRYCTPSSVCTTAGGNVEFTADGVVLSVLERLIPFTGEVTMRVSTTSPQGSVDTASLPITLGGGRPVGFDLSSFAAERPADAPFFEAFTIPTLNPFGVWDRIREELGLWEEEVDGLAIFQTFPTDIQFYATAYSTGGNSGADGVWADSEDFYGSGLPRTPALLHMNRIVAGDDSVGRRNFRNFLLAHEFGHRWLYSLSIDQGDGPSFVLNPLTAHPAQYVHTPAAFRVMTGRDYSVMGGSNFTEHQDGTFQAPDEEGAWGYSWHELYLMGLAAPREVSNWYYIADSDPELGPAYHADPGIRVSGRKVEVTLRHLTSSIGERAPVAEDSQKIFRLLYVLLQFPSTDATGETSLLNETVDAFPPFFATATGGRGAVISSLPVAPTSRFELADRAATNSSVSFRDTSLHYPARWRWDFGDGGSSSEQFPRHAYTEPGTYTVSLTVENSRGESTSEQVIVVEDGARRRPVRR